MGLDMFLSAKRHLWYNETELKEQLGAPLALPEGLKVEGVTVEAAYWRKANHIHKWFVDNVQEGEDDCGSYSVRREKFQELINLCKQIQADPTLADKLLPTRSGFFFGPTEYGEYYMQDIESTIVQLERALGLGEKYDFYYQASW